MNLSDLSSKLWWLAVLFVTLAVRCGGWEDGSFPGGQDFEFSGTMHSMMRIETLSMVHRRRPNLA